MKTAARMLTLCLKRTGALYVLILFVVFWAIIPEELTLARINGLRDFGSYPKDFLRGEASFDRRAFVYAKKYYQNLLKSVSFYYTIGVMDATTSARVYAMMALCEYYLGKPARAAELYKKAKSLQPDDYWLGYNLGLVYFNQGDYSSAIPYFRKVIWTDGAVLERSMRLDYFQFWPPQIRDQYLANAQDLMRKVVSRSLELLTASEEHLRDPRFEYQNKYPFVYNPSMDFLPIGQEVIVTKQYLNAVAQEKNNGL